MTISGRGLKRHVAGCVLLAALAPLMAAGQQVRASQFQGSNSSARPQSPELGAGNPNSLPDSPGSVRSETIADNRLASQQDSQFPQAQSQAGGAQQTSSQTSQSPQNNAQQPVGTAAAGAVKATGIAASQPAGAAIAPAKQRRTRSVLIKVGVLAGAAVAVGTVVALSAASPSRPR